MCIRDRGFTDMDPEGMLTWGFDQLGTMPTIYNYSYYPEHIEAPVSYTHLDVYKRQGSGC